MNNVKLSLSDFEKNHYIISQALLDSVVVGLGMKPIPAIALRGKAGTGKTFLVKTISQVLSIPLLKWDAFRGASETDLFYTLVPDENSKSGIRKFDGVLTRGARDSESHQVIIYLDEWDKIRESADSVLLNFLQDGEINVEGVRCRANLDNIIIFIGMNEERPYSEYFRRRLCFIDFDYLSEGIVREALEMTHKGHPQLEPAVRLYSITVKAELEKPATIQELRQLLDACSQLGNRADWDKLVYQFVTKDRESHSLVKRLSNQLKVEDFIPRKEEKENWNYEILQNEEPESNKESEPEIKQKLPTFRPRVKIISKIGENREVNVGNDDEVALVCENTPDALTTIVRGRGNITLTENSNDLGNIVIKNDLIIAKNPIEFPRDAPSLYTDDAEMYLYKDFEKTEINCLKTTNTMTDDDKLSLIKEMTSKIFKIVSINRRQVVFQYKYDEKLLFSFNFEKSKIEISTSSRSRQETREFLKVSEDIIFDHYENILHGFKFPSMITEGKKSDQTDKTAENQKTVEAYLNNSNSNLFKSFISNLKELEYNNDRKIIAEREIFYLIKMSEDKLKDAVKPNSFTKKVKDAIRSIDGHGFLWDYNYLKDINENKKTYKLPKILIDFFKSVNERRIKVTNYIWEIEREMEARKKLKANEVLK